MTTLQDATLALAKTITSVKEGTATGGSGTTLVNNLAGFHDEADDYYTGGVIWFLSGLNAGKSAHINDWDLATFTFTFTTPGAACAAGDRYAVVPLDFPRWLLVQSVNEALKDLGDLPATSTALVTVADQEKYDLPAGVRNVQKVEIAYALTSPLAYYPHHNWREYNDDLLFDTDLAPEDDDYTIRLWYLAAHAELTADSGVVTPYVHVDRLRWASAVHALRWLLRKRKGDDAYLREQLNEALTNAEFEKRRHPIEIDIQRDPHLAKW